MAPDIALASVDVIEKTNLHVKKQIGSGGLHMSNLTTIFTSRFFFS